MIFYLILVLNCQEKKIYTNVKTFYHMFMNDLLKECCPFPYILQHIA